MSVKYYPSGADAYILPEPAAPPPVGIFDATLPADLASAQATGASLFASRADHVHRFPTSLMEYANNDTLALTSNGTDETLTWSRSGAKLILKDIAAATIAEFYSSTGVSRGLAVRNSLLVGPGTSDTGTTPYGAAVVFTVGEALSSRAFFGLFKLGAVLDADIIDTTITLADYSSRIATGFDISGSGSLIYHRVGNAGSSGAVLTGGASKVALYSGSFQTTLEVGSPVWTELVGLDLSSHLNCAGVAATRSIGILCTPIQSATTQWDAIFGTNGVQLNTTGKLIFGGSSTSKGINSIRRGATTTNLLVEINSANEYDIRAASLARVASSTSKSLGLVTTQGWSGVFLQDTVATKTLQLRTTTTGVAADTILTIDPVGASRTITFSGDPTLADWFDQSVKVAASPTFTTATLMGYTFGAVVDGEFLKRVGANIVSAAAGGATATTVETDLGSTAVWRGKFTITDAAIASTSKVLCWQAPGPYTGKGTRADEAEIQPVEVIEVEPATGSAVVKWQTPPMLAQAIRIRYSLDFGAIIDKDPPLRFGSPVQRLHKVRGNVKFSYAIFA